MVGIRTLYLLDDALDYTLCNAAFAGQLLVASTNRLPCLCAL